MVRKITACMLLCVLLVGALCTQANAATHTIYDNGTMSATYVTYFKDIIAGMKFNDNYVAFRSAQYEYTMIVGDLEYNNGVISLNGSGKEYRFYSTSTTNYGQIYSYSASNIDNFSLNTYDRIIYSDVGDYPQLIERGAKYEIITTALLCICCVSIVINRIFYKRFR